MKRLLVAAALALGLHGLLLGSRPGWLRPPTRPAWKSGSVMVTLSYREGESAQAESKASPAHLLPTPPQKKAAREKQGEKVGDVRKPIAETPRESPHEEPVRKSKHRTRHRPPQPMKSPIQPKQPPPSPTAPTPRADEQKRTAKPRPGSGPEEGKPTLRAGQASISKKAHTPGSPASRRGEAVLRESRPLYRKNPAPSYPAVARRRGYEGTVLLEVLVDKGGRVAELRVEESSGHAMLDQAALRSVRRWRFEPAVRGNEKVSMWVRVPIRFQLR